MKTMQLRKPSVIKVNPARNSSGAKNQAPKRPLPKGAGSKLLRASSNNSQTRSDASAISSSGWAFSKVPVSLQTPVGSKSAEQREAERLASEHAVPLDDKTRLDIFHRRRNGESIESVAAHFGLSRARVTRVISEEHLKRVLEFALDFIPNVDFPRTSPSSEREILGASPENAAAAKKTPRPSGLPPYLASMYETPLLNREQEQHLFRKMNYLKFKASTMRERLDPDRPSMAAMQQIARLYEQAVEVKNDIVRANLRLVISIAKRYAVGPAHLFELISDGNMSLIRAVEKFDFARGFRFSTYATWAIMKNFARTIPAELKVRARFHSGGDDQLQVVEDIHPNAILQESAQNERQDEVSRILEHLNDREKQIIQHRFGLNEQRNAMTLKEVGRVMGVTKERIRQLEARAMAKLRDAVGKEHVEVPEDLE